MDKGFEEILQNIHEECVSLDELLYLQNHQQEVLDTGNVELCEAAGIPEEDYRKRWCGNYIKQEEKENKHD